MERHAELNSELSFSELIKGILFCPKSLFTYIVEKKFTKYYLGFILLFAFLNALNAVWEKMTPNLNDWLVLLVALIPIKMIVTIVGEIALLLFLYLIALVIGGKGNIKEFIKVNSFSNLPLILSFLLTNILFFIDESFKFLSPMVLKGLFGVEVICGIWTFVLSLFSISSTMKLSLTRSFIVSFLAVVFICFIMYLILIPYFFSY